MDKNTGGPAFPATMEQLSYQIDGMTLRDYFAAKAMQGQYTAVFRPVFSGDENSVLDALDNSAYMDIASNSYAMADAMLKAREQ
jgi:hypothetical protein